MVGVALEGAGRGIGSSLSSCTHTMGPGKAGTNAALSAGLTRVRLVLVCLHQRLVLVCLHHSQPCCVSLSPPGVSQWPGGTFLNLL